MKIRTSFVSNSSSSSFVVDKCFLTQEQIDKIYNHIEVSQNENFEDILKYTSSGDEWEIEETEKTLEGSTFMDNFSMSDFMKKIGVDTRKVNWECY